VNEEGTIIFYRRGSPYSIHGVFVDNMIHATNDVKYFQEFGAKLASRYDIT
jgi:hypothetical protein